MKLTYTKKCVILFIIGLLLIVLDVNVDSGKSYPKEYNNSDTVIGEFQYYNIKSAYGATCTYKLLDESSETEDTTYTGATVIDKVFYSNIQIDVFNDFVGLLLIAISGFLMAKGSSKFKLAAVMSIMALIIHGIIAALPFVINGLVLCNIVFFLSIMYFMSFIILSLFYTKGLFSLSRDVCCRDERIWMQTSWIIISALFALATFTSWLGSDFAGLTHLSNVFIALSAIMIVVYYLIARRTLDYVQKNYDLAINAKS